MDCSRPPYKHTQGVLYLLVSNSWGLLPGLPRTPYRCNTENSVTQPVGRVTNRRYRMLTKHRILTLAQTVLELAGNWERDR